MFGTMRLWAVTLFKAKVKAFQVTGPQSPISLLGLSELFKDFYYLTATFGTEKQQNT